MKQIGLFTILWIMCCAITANAQISVAAHYIGELIVHVENDGRHMTLIEPFAYVDPNGVQWNVPAGTTTDGASIPQAFWSIMGGPFEGKYRDAAVVHDYYCDVRVVPWTNVDRMFYDAMITSGVSETKAKVMYAAVYEFGPHWDEQTIINSRLTYPEYPHVPTIPVPSNPTQEAAIAGPLFEGPSGPNGGGWDQLRRAIEVENLSLDEIDQRVVIQVGAPLPH